MTKSVAAKRILIAVLAAVLVLFGLAASAYADPELASSSAATPIAPTQASSASESAAAAATGEKPAKEPDKGSRKEPGKESEKAGDASTSSSAAAGGSAQEPASAVDRALDRQVIHENSRLSTVEGAEPDTGGSTFTFVSPIKYAQIPGDVYWLSNHPQLIGSRVGNDVLLEVSQIGKVCHTKCAIYHLAGDCIFPREGVFFVALNSGDVHVGDPIVVEELGDGTCEFTPQAALDELAQANR